MFHREPEGEKERSEILCFLKFLNYVIYTGISCQLSGPEKKITRGTRLYSHELCVFAFPCSCSCSAGGRGSSKYVLILPLPFTSIRPRSSQEKSILSETKSYVSSEICTRPGKLEVSIRLDVFTVSPNKQYRGMRLPTTPDATSPEWMPTRSLQNSSLGIWCFEAASRALSPNLTAAQAQEYLSECMIDCVRAVLVEFWPSPHFLRVSMDRIRLPVADMW